MTIREMMAMYHSLQFVEELLDYIEQYPDDDYMTMECLCRKLVKYKLMKKIDGYYIADRKTESNSEIPNNCEWSVEYAKEMLDTMPCEECGHWEHGAGDHYYCALLEMRQECFFESKDESTLMFANKPKDEPQTDLIACPIVEDDAWIYEEYQRGIAYAWEVAQKVFDSTLTFYEAEDLAKQIRKTEQTDVYDYKGNGEWERSE